MKEVKVTGLRSTLDREESDMEKENARASMFDYPPESTIGDQALRSPGLPARRKIFLSLRCVFEPARNRQRIAKKAYELYLERGKVHGHDVDDWLEAERIIAAELNLIRKRRAS